MSNELKNVLTIKIQLIPLTQCSLLVEHNFNSSCHNSENIDVNCCVILCCVSVLLLKLLALKSNPGKTVLLLYFKIFALGFWSV